jgi:hypothetical protein
MLAIEKIAKNRKKLECKLCDYSTCNSFDFKKHEQTEKHASVSQAMAIDNLAMNLLEKSQKKDFTCLNCNKVYKDNSGLWRHKKKCENYSYSCDNTEEISNKITPELILNVLKQNKELSELVVEQNKTIMELAKNGKSQNNTVISNNNINSNNKTFNLNVFLNETCKDAMNIMDFIDSLQLQLSDLENKGRVGIVEGISSILVKKLQAMDIHKRPVHCADRKREVVYIKDDDKWERETSENTKMKKVIKKVSCKNQRLLPKFKEAHPNCNMAESQYCDQYSKIMIESMDDNNDEKINKIIKNITKEVVIDKRIELID